MQDSYTINRPYEGVQLPVLHKRTALEILAAAWTAVKVGTIIAAYYVVVLGAKSYHETLPVPMKLETAPSTTVSARDIERLKLTTALKYLQCPTEKLKQLSDGILKGAKAINVDPDLILALLYTESRFKINAVSPKRYKGYMQTPWASMEYADVDILYGCRILEEKMNSPQAKVNGRTNLRTALALYKGGLSGTAFSQADEVLRLYKTLRTL